MTNKRAKLEFLNGIDYYAILPYNIRTFITIQFSDKCIVGFADNDFFEVGDELCNRKIYSVYQSKQLFALNTKQSTIGIK